MAAFPGKGCCSACTSLCGGGSTSACPHTLSWRVCACASTLQQCGMAGKALLSCQRERGVCGQVEIPNYGVACVTVAPMSRWQQLGSLESGHTLPGPGQPLGDPPGTGVWIWNSHSWTFIPIGVEGNRMIPSVLLVVAVLISHLFRLDIRKRLFMQRVFAHWKRVPREAVMASSLTEYREHLDL